MKTGYLITKKKLSSIPLADHKTVYNVYKTLRGALLSVGEDRSDDIYIWKVEIEVDNILGSTRDYYKAQVFRAIQTSVWELQEKPVHTKRQGFWSFNTIPPPTDVEEGHFNRGSCNTGNYNTGDVNAGHYNLAGARLNTGNYNAGCEAYNNTGNFNTGGHHTGNHNFRGRHNSGSHNYMSRQCSGDYNYNVYHSESVFCTQTPLYIYVCDKLCDVSDSYNRLDFMLGQVSDSLLWVPSNAIANKARITQEITSRGGYLKSLSYEGLAELFFLMANAEYIRFISHFTMSPLTELMSNPLIDLDEIESLIGVCLREVMESEPLPLYVRANKATSGAFGFYESTGVKNSGPSNVGNYNSGANNVGDCNSGFDNRGNYNSGFSNVGNYNSGRYNFGDQNTGVMNKANRCTGKFNFTDNSAGLFNQYEHGAFFFNKPSALTLSDWHKIKAYDILVNHNTKHNQNNPDKKIIPCFYKVKPNHKMPLKFDDFKNRKVFSHSFLEFDSENWFNQFWETLNAEERDIVTGMPNFDKEIFGHITGVVL